MLQPVLDVKSMTNWYSLRNRLPLIRDGEILQRTELQIADFGMGCRPGMLSAAVQDLIINAAAEGRRK